MYKVLIFGTGKSSVVVKQMLNKQVNILAYIDNDKSKCNKNIDNVKIFSPQYIKDFNYDYIIIASQYNEEIYKQLINIGIEKHKIFQYYKFIDNYYNLYNYYINFFIEKTSEVEVLTTGISYASNGFNEDICCKKAFKFSMGSQDIYYDYHTIKYLLSNYRNKTNNVRYVIIGLCYYSFQYDMSLSAMKDKVMLYYPVLKKSHNFNRIEDIYKECEINKSIADKILAIRKGRYYEGIKIPTLNDYEDKWSTGKKQAERDCDKNYPQTVKENTQIFKDYLQLLKDYNMKPIVVVYPATKYYTKCFSKRIEDEFHSIIKKVKKEYDFQYIDYFRSDLFIDDDFVDVSHLNVTGSEKFTKILNEEIHW